MKRVMLLSVVEIASLFTQGTATAQNGPDSKKDRSSQEGRGVKSSAKATDGSTCKVTKQEWMNFMAAEFDRLANNSGQIDLSKRRQENRRIVPFSSLGK